MELKKSRIVLFIVMSLVLPSLGQAKPTSSLNSKGNKLYLKGEYQKALELYKRAESQDPKSPAISNNLGNVAHQQQNFEEAGRYYQRALENTNQRELANTYYNLGNNYFRGSQLEQAMASYERCLELNPNDLDAKYNLEFIKRTQKQNQKQQQENSEQKEKQTSGQEKENKEEQKKQQEQKEKGQEKQASEQQSEKEKQKEEQGAGSQQKMSKEEAERILSAVREQEKELLEKQKRFGEPKRGKIGRDW